MITLNISPKEDLINGLHQYSFIIRGKGRMPGKEFANECRKVYSDDNPRNAHYYALFEKCLIFVERRPNGMIHVKYSLP